MRKIKNGRSMKTTKRRLGNGGQWFALIDANRYVTGFMEEVCRLKVV